MTVADIERIGAPEIDPGAARKAFLEYKRAVLDETDKQRQREYETLMRGYRAIASGRQVIDLIAVMKAAGLQADTYYPKLAIVRADAEKCHVYMREEGSAVFSPLLLKHLGGPLYAIVASWDLTPLEQAIMRGRF